MDLRDLVDLLESLESPMVTKEEFERHSLVSRELMPALNDQQKLMLYSLFKQATVGDAPEAAPTEDQLSPDYMKWQYWRGLCSLARTDAVRLYCFFINQFREELQSQAQQRSGGSSDGKDFGGVGSSVSTLFVDYQQLESAPQWTSADLPLFKAIVDGNAEALLEALQSGVNANELNPEGIAALHFAVDNDDLGAVQLLLAQPGVDVNVRDSSQQTPLMYAALCDFKEVAEALLGATAVDVEAVNADGESALDLASEGSAVQALLQSALGTSR